MMSDLTCHIRMIGDLTCHIRICDLTSHIRMIGDLTCHFRMIGDLTSHIRMIGDLTCHIRMIGDLTCEPWSLADPLPLGDRHQTETLNLSPRIESSSLTLNEVKVENWVVVFLTGQTLGLRHTPPLTDVIGSSVMRRGG